MPRRPSPAFEAAGGKVIGADKTPVQNPDFSAFVQRVKDANPEAVFVFIPGGAQPAALGKALAERGLTPPAVKVMGQGELTHPEALVSMGDNANGIITTFHYTLERDDPLNKEYVAGYTAANNGREPDLFSIGGYDGMHLIYEALKKTNGDTDGDKLVEAAKGMSWTSPRGPMSIDPETRDEVKSKLSSFVRARWFAPPFGGLGFTNLLIDALDAMAASEHGPRLLPDNQPLDLFVTVTDFHGHPERLRLNSPPEVVETEHRLVIGFSDRDRDARGIGHAAELAFAARATASFPGAFPPFTVGELDGVLKSRKRGWPGRAAFLKRALPRQSAAEMIDRTVLIDGSVLANAPFKPAIDALRNRPARREVDRRFVYIDPKPGIRSIGLPKGEEDALPGFFGTIFGALSNLPRTQPIRDNLEQIERRSSRIRRMRAVVEALRPEVEDSIE